MSVSDIAYYSELCLVCVKDLRKKRDDERQKQLRWREEHRNALLQGHVIDRDSSDNGGDSLPGPPGPPPPPAPSSATGGPPTSIDSLGRTRALYDIEPGHQQAFRQKQWRQVTLILLINIGNVCVLTLCQDSHKKSYRLTHAFATLSRTVNWPR